MREERGRLPGGTVINEAMELWGSVGGNVSVVDGGKLYMRGAIYGDLTVEDGGRVHIFGNVQGNITVREGSKVIHSGICGRDIINTGGRLVVEAGSKVLGKVKTKSGETKLEGRHRDG